MWYCTKIFLPNRPSMALRRNSPSCSKVFFQTLVLRLSWMEYQLPPNSLDSGAHRRPISALSLYYRYYHGVCSEELKSIIPPKALFTRNTWLALSCLRPASADTFNSYPAHNIPLFLFFSRWRGQPRPLEDAPFLRISFSHQYHKKKKKNH